ncbi:peptidoglycan DD-metalloendopeptidase family protein [Parahaliea sp. F7430]|uniref:Peptidoglycan DD-metalloendopeptidase family protein n=1 Tax=Sediminihaliea albiluteola TaxID=2758564 RepID=A0A7W2YKH2_9GAMM|nr:peptidoglycan DD-metalloendopeptidase family protein [Sediminihaliea albiluteola]MBA6414112.1 peptidoglycan DD-metalloendopeptidase family protein [Sediminihaliea albiluteola]
MKINTKPRGATIVNSDSAAKPKTSRHLLAVATITACVAIAASLAPGGDVEANRSISELSELESEQAVERILSATNSPATEQIAPAIEDAEPSALVELEQWQEQTVRSGDNLSLIFKRAGFDNNAVHELVYGAPDGKDLAKIYPGQTIAFLSSDENQLLGVKHVISALESVTYRRDESGSFVTERDIRQPEVRETWATGEITSSLFMAGKNMGLSQLKIMELADIFGGVIDFVLDPRKGDTIHVVYEELYLDGEKYRDGEILAASFTNRGETFSAYRFADSQGDVSYYNEQGVSMRKAFLMAPVDFTRISSNFNLRRLHPIYKTTRPHRGTDYAAPTGTPVYAAGDGKVIKAGYTRANGNYVFIQHGDRYVTRYLHLHQRKVKQGQRVAQNAVIGTVGSTGAATGPHLHYEFLVDGVHRNPRTIHKELPKAKSLAASELPRFQEMIAPAAQQLASLQSATRLALNNATAGDSSQR